MLKSDMPGSVMFLLGHGAVGHGGVGQHWNLKVLNQIPGFFRLFRGWLQLAIAQISGRTIHLNVQHLALTGLPGELDFFERARGSTGHQVLNVHRGIIGCFNNWACKLYSLAILVCTG